MSTPTSTCTSVPVIAYARLEALRARGPICLPPPAERWYVKWLFAAIAIAVAGMFWMLVEGYWAPAHAGVDQNGYLVGGRMFASHGSTRMELRNPATGAFEWQQFVGIMWVGADLNKPAERYYPKYPIGLPVLVAGALKAGELVDRIKGLALPRWGTLLTYYLSPVCMTLAVLGTFLLVRRLAGSAIGVIAAILMGTSPVTLGLANNPNSHASTVCFVTWGMYLLMCWWERGGLLRAAGAGFLVGYAATIRYTEGTLILPLVLVAVFRTAGAWRRGQPGKSSLFECGMLLAWWALPVLALVVFNLAEMGHWTGYDPCNESTGFRWEYFNDNWDTMLRHLNNTGMVFIFPLAVAGMISLFARSWQFALVYFTWIVPTLLVYSAYYWAPDAENRIGYLRFFLTAFPAMLACAASLAIGAAPAAGGVRRWWPSIWRITAAGGVAAIAILLNKESALPLMDVEQRSGLMTAYSTERIITHIPRGALVFLEGGGFSNGMANHIQFAGNDYRIYSLDLYTKANADRLRQFSRARSDEDPQGLDPARRTVLMERMSAVTQEQLTAALRGTIDDALRSGRPVYFIVSGKPSEVRPRPTQGSRWAPPSSLRTAIDATTEAQVVTYWGNVVPPDPPRDAARGPRGFQQQPMRPRGNATGQFWQVIAVKLKPAPPPA